MRENIYDRLPSVSCRVCRPLAHEQNPRRSSRQIRHHGNITPMENNATENLAAHARKSGREREHWHSLEHAEHSAYRRGALLYRGW